MGDTEFSMILDPAGASDPGPALGPVGSAPKPAAGRVAAFFDIDNTIIRGASAFHLALGLRQRGIVTWRNLAVFALRNARYQLFGEDASSVDATQSDALAIVKDRPVAQIAAVGEQVYDEVLANRIYPGTRDLLDSHRASGHEIWLVSASPIEIASLMAVRFGVTGALGTQAEHKDGFYTGTLNGGLMHGAAKAQAVRDLAARRGLDLARSYAYGDSVNDVPLLKEVGHPCGINPDRKLRLVCSREGWPLREVRGRRGTVRRRLRTASNVGAAWAAFAVLQTILRRLRPRR